MIDDRVWTIANFIPHALQSPAQVYFFKMGKEIGIEALSFFPSLGFDEQCSARRPKYLSCIIVLAMVFFYFIQDPTSAERKPKIIYIAASCSCMFKLAFVMLRLDFRLARHIQGFLFHVADHMIHSILRYFHIGIQ